MVTGHHTIHPPAEIQRVAKSGVRDPVPKRPFLLREKDFVETKPSGVNMFRALGATFKNREFRVFVGSDVMYWIGLTLFQTGLPFFVQTSMKLDISLTMYFMGGMTVLSAAFYPMVAGLTRKFGKKKLTICGFLGLALAYLITALINVNILPGAVFGVAICVIAAFPMALLGIIPQAIVADVAEADGRVTGENKEGMFFAARTFAMKWGQSIAMLVFTSLAIIGTTQNVNANDITATTPELTHSVTQAVFKYNSPNYRGTGNNQAIWAYGGAGAAGANRATNAAVAKHDPAACTATGSVTMSDPSVSSSFGTGGSHNNMQPYVVVNYIISIGG